MFIQNLLFTMAQVFSSLRGANRTANLPPKGPKSETFRLPQPPVFFQKYCRTNGGRTAVQMGGVLQYKWEAYCRVSLSSKLRSQRYKWGAYCRTNWRCTAALFRQVVGVGVSETLPTKPCRNSQYHYTRKDYRTELYYF